MQSNYYKGSIHVNLKVKLELLFSSEGYWSYWSLVRKVGNCLSVIGGGVDKCLS